MSPYLILSLTLAVAGLAAAAPGTADSSGVRGRAAADTAELPSARSRAAAPFRGGVQVIGQEDLSRRENLAEALKAVPGFRIRSQGGLGGYSETWFRGSDGRQVAVYLDGMPLNTSLEPAVDLGKIPALIIREMEVDKGGLAAEEGPEASAAAIRLSTLPLGNSPVSVTGRLSSFGGQEAALSAKAGSGNAALYLTAGLQSARNDYPFPTDNGTAFVGGDDFDDEIRNNAYEGRWLGLSWRETGKSGRLGFLGARYEAQRKEYPGIYTDDSRAYTEREELSFHGRWRDTLPADFLEGFTAGAMARLASDAFRDPDRTLGYTSYSLDREGRLFSGSLGIAARLPLAASLKVGSRAGYEASDSRETERFREFQPPDADRAFAEPSAALEAPIGPAGADGPWGGGLAGRAEALLGWERLKSSDLVGIAGNKTAVPLERDSRAATWRLGLEWRGDRPEAGVTRSRVPRLLGLLAEFESVERLPALHEILGDNNGVHRNMSLAPQSALGASLEAALRAGPLQVTGGPFWQICRDPIRLGPLGASNFLRFGNGADYRSLGLEARLDASGRRWRAGNAFTAAWPENLEGPAAGKLPAYSSRVENLADLSLSPIPALWIDLELEWRSSYFPNDRNLPGSRRPAEAEAGMGLRWRKRRLEAALRADNLGDAHYRDFAYSPKSGRRVSFRLSMNP